MPNDESHFVPAEDIEAVQAIVLAAAIQGDEACRGQLPRLSQDFEEPYRTIATTVNELLLGGGFIDQNTVRAALAGARLTRRDAGGKVEELTIQQAINLVSADQLQPGQAGAYLQVLDDQLKAKRLAEFRARAQETVQQFGHDPGRLLREVGSLVAQQRRDVMHAYQPESLRLIPYFQKLMQLQTGGSFLGLDSGFPLLNQITNGLDTGLWVIAAPPSLGKTTLVWQLCQQVARLNKVPVIFVSIEQGAEELRVKALARLSKLNSRHIARGRFRSDNPEHSLKLQEAAEEYFGYSRYLTIIEGDDTTTIDEICEVAAAKMAQLRAGRCLVAVDYLQILPVSESNQGRVTSPKDRVDLHVSALRRMARQLESPVIAISSENRAGYKSKQLDVFKESGGIEYSCDIAAIMTRDKEATQSAAGKYRVVDFNIVKHRNGGRGVVKFKFCPDRAEFIEESKGTLPEDQEE